MQDFTDSSGFANISRPKRIFVVGLILISLAVIWFGHATFGDQTISFGFDLLLFTGIYALVNELDATKRQLRRVQQVVKIENANVTCQTVNVTNGDEG